MRPHDLLLQKWLSFFFSGITRLKDTCPLEWGLFFIASFSPSLFLFLSLLSRGWFGEVWSLVCKERARKREREGQSADARGREKFFLLALSTPKTYLSVCLVNSRLQPPVSPLSEAASVIPLFLSLFLFLSLSLSVSLPHSPLLRFSLAFLESRFLASLCDWCTYTRVCRILILLFHPHYCIERKKERRRRTAVSWSHES